ncbi:hypothetical protein, partial [Kaarinaea lacus]
MANVFLTAAMADTPPQDAPPQDTPKQEEPPSISALEPFDNTVDIISHQVVRLADSIDTFFAGDRVYEELQESHVKVYLLQTHTENEKPLYETKIKAKLTFPKTERRLKLLIETDEVDEEESQAQQESIASAAEKSDQSVGLRFVETETETWRVQTDALLRFHSGEIQTVARLRLRNKTVVGDWLFRTTETISWNSSEGAKETTRLNIDNNFAEKWLFRSSTFATWKNINGYFNYGQDLIFFQSINKRKALTYQVGARGITEDTPHTTDY